VTDDEAVNSMVSTVLSQTGRIDVLVNNTGIGLLGCRRDGPARVLRGPELNLLTDAAHREPIADTPFHKRGNAPATSWGHASMRRSSNDFTT
jgi:NAD(P)-dependent dehydrogenase (short-subunit alcohol dehydrogenase family)